MHSLDVLETGEMCMVIIYQTNMFFIDNGISGRKSKKRHDFLRMIGLAKTKPASPFEAILLWKFNRFARNQEESIVYKSMLRKKCNVDVISTTQQTTKDIYGDLIERIIEWTDEFYSIQLGGRRFFVV